MRSLEIVENCYDNDSFEEEDEEEMEGEDREGSAPSETGTALLNIYLICGFSTSIFTDFDDIKKKRKNTYQTKTFCVGNILSI